MQNPETIYGLNSLVFDSIKNQKSNQRAIETRSDNFENLSFLSESADDLVYQFYWEAHFEDVDMKSN